MSATLRVEVETKGDVSASSSSPERAKTFNEIKAEREAAAAQFRADANRMREESGKGGVVSEKEERLRDRAERKQRIAEDKQERDEAFYERQQAKAQKKAEAEQRKAEAIQARNEDYAERQEAREARRAEAEAAKIAKQEEAKAREEANKKAHEEEAKPENIAKRMIERDTLRRSSQIEYTAQKLGISPGANVTKMFQGMSNTGAALARRFGILAAGAIALAETWKAARNQLMEEANRVRRYSPALRFQQAINNLRNQMTDLSIAQKYGGRMSQIEDMQNRRDNAWREIKTGLAASFDKLASSITDPIEEWYTSMLEKFAGISDKSGESNAYLAKILDVSEQQLEEIGIKPRNAREVEFGLKQAEKVLKILGTNGFDRDEEIGKMFGDEQLALRPGANPEGFVRVPDFWRNQ